MVPMAFHTPCPELTSTHSVSGSNIAKGSLRVLCMKKYFQQAVGSSLSEVASQRPDRYLLLPDRILVLKWDGACKAHNTSLAHSNFSTSDSDCGLYDCYFSSHCFFRAICIRKKPKRNQLHQLASEELKVSLRDQVGKSVPKYSRYWGIWCVFLRQYKILTITNIYWELSRCQSLTESL